MDRLLINRMKEKIESLYRVSHRFFDFFNTGWRKHLFTNFFLVISLILILLLAKGSWADFQKHGHQLRPIWIVCAVAFFAVDLLISFWCWHLLIARFANYDNAKETIKIYVQTNLARRVPGMVWHLASRALSYEKVGISKTNTTLIGGLEMVLFLVSGAAVTLMMLPIWLNQSNNVDATQIALVFVMLILSSLFVHPTVLGRIWQAVAKTQPNRTVVWHDSVLWLFYYIIIWLLGGIVFFCVINFFTPVSYHFLPTLTGIWAFTGTLSLMGYLSLSLFGVREASMILLLSAVIPTPTAILVTAAIRILWLLGEIIPAIIAFKL